ncbi:unnamed protein product [Sympodiomycopsis kandeliae]
MRFTATALTVTAAALASQAMAAPAPLMDELWARASSSITSDVNVAKSKKYTHVVVGCGLGGLTTAVRLSENKANTVLCIEAGGDSRKDSRIVSLGSYGASSGSELEWSWHTTNQDSTGTSKTIRGGQTLGGSTAINNGAFTMGDAAQYDAIGELGNSGWSWSSLEPYLKKFQNWHAPTDQQSRAGAQSDASAHGQGGPVDVSFTPGFYTGPQQKAFVQGVKEALGVDQVADLTAGNANAVAYTQNTVQPTGDRIRVSSATAYLTPVEYNRPNLVVLINYRGIKINWTKGSGSNSRATSVTAGSSRSGPTTDFAASKEVILASGAIRTPVLLEGSGVGDPSILSGLGVKTQINLPGVGKNLMEQTMNSIGSKKGNYDFGGNGPSSVIAYPSISQIMSNSSDVRSWVEQNIDSWAQDQVNAGAVANKAGLVKQYQLATKLIFDRNAPVVELFGDSGYPQSGLGIDHWQLLPFSRGTVHSSDASGFSSPIVNPRYFSNPLDMQITVAGLRSSRKTLQSDAIKSALNEVESLPGFDASQGGIPDGSNHGRYDRWQNWVLHGNGGAGFSSVHHPIGTASMMPEADGGVVDSNFKVYHTDNVRIVDASVLPLQLSAHLSASLYTIAEKAADVIGRS